MLGDGQQWLSQLSLKNASNRKPWMTEIDRTTQTWFFLACVMLGMQLGSLFAFVFCSDSNLVSRGEDVLSNDVPSTARHDEQKLTA